MKQGEIYEVVDTLTFLLLNSRNLAFFEVV